MLSKLISAVIVMSSLFAISAASPQQGKASRDRQAVAIGLPRDYRDWRVISIAHEEGSLNDIRAILGNRAAVEAYRSGTRPFPDGAALVRLAYRYVPSNRNNTAFGQPQSFVAGEPTNVQISLKNAKRFRSTGGWGYAQFKDGRVDPTAQTAQTCAACHARMEFDRDRVFTDYAR